MDGTDGGLDTLSRRGRVALRRLLIRATARAGRPIGAGELEPLVRAAPIDALPAAAALHRVSGTVLRGLDGVDGVPAEVRARLAAVRDRSAFRHLLTIGALDQIARAFDAAGLSWVVMKGPVVAALLYPAVGDRSYGDLDLLVDRHGFGEAMRLLESFGYEHVIHNWALAEETLAGEISMTSRAVPVDLHWHLHYSREDRRQFAIDPTAMLRRARHVDLSGVRAPTLDPVDTLISLAFHAARSDGHRIIWLKDIERSLSVERPDLDELVRRCHEYRCAAPVGLMLSRSRATLDAEVPERVIHQLMPLPLRISARATTSLVDPLQFHERGTPTRAFTRSVRSSTMAGVAAAPARVVQSLRRKLSPPADNETDDEAEKDSYLRAVAESAEP